MVTLRLNMQVRSSRCFTFHVALSFENDESVASTTSLLVTDYSHPFNAAETFEFPAQIVFCGAFMLVDREYFCKADEIPKTYQTRYEECLVGITHGFGIICWFICDDSSE